MPAQTKPQRGRNRKGSPGQFRAAVAFASLDDARHSLLGNPNAAKRNAAPFDRDSATAKRDGIATQGARLARKSPLGNRGSRFGNERTPSLPLGPAGGR